MSLIAWPHGSSALPALPPWASLNHSESGHHSASAYDQLSFWQGGENMRIWHQCYNINVRRVSRWLVSEHSADAVIPPVSPPCTDVDDNKVVHSEICSNYCDLLWKHVKTFSHSPNHLSTSIIFYFRVKPQKTIFCVSNQGIPVIKKSILLGSF